MPIDLSGEKSGGLVSLSDISTRQEISKEYMEQIG
jgi:DNA-binding IscR family transcriptional regulator